MWKGKILPAGHTRTAVALLTISIATVALFPPVSLQAQDELDEPSLSEEDRDHWSFRPLQRPPVPKVEFVEWPRTAIDHFVLARMEETELGPLPEADRATLIRRVHFDLVGLPPTPAEVLEFVNDPRVDAYERLIDRLLASPSYGERWGQHWLDLARFAETDGFEHDHIRPNAWRYRDWVINSLNADLPYDDFVRQQLAGDEIDSGTPATTIATGFLLCGPDMPDINLQAERRHTFLNDMTATVGAVFMGLQIGCAQCHHHKFDPISQHDFYRLRTFFESTDLFREVAISSESDRQTRSKLEKERSRKWQQLQSQIDQLLRQQRAALQLDAKSPDAQVVARLRKPERELYLELKSTLDQIKKSKPPELPLGRVIRESTQTPKPGHLWIRGSFLRPGPKLQAEFPRIANASHTPVRFLPTARTTGLRTQLANWLVQPEHPLTTRVFANRIWQHHFGQGLSPSASDFGIMGDEPSHPQLLDWLATELPRRGWSLKAIHRLILTSAVYRQASRPRSPDWELTSQASVRDLWRRAREHDPDNVLLVGMVRRRLEGEAIRDAMLAMGGNLSQRRGGPGVRPPLPAELLTTLLKNQWPITKDVADHSRRSIYLFVRRNLRYPIFDVFDKPDTNSSCPRRNRSTIAPQALTLFNSKLSHDAATDFAQRIAQEADHEQERIVLCFLYALNRRPTEAELTSSAQFLREFPHNQSAADQSLDALTQFCLTMMNLNEFIYVD